MTSLVSVNKSRLDGFDERVSHLVNHEIPSKVADRDATLWGPDAVEESSKRLGWVSDPRDLEPLVAELKIFRDELRAQGVNRVVLCGMGGSSLAPEVMAKRDRVALEILDSTHPDQVARALNTNLVDTVVVIASKSGTTVETATARASFQKAFADQGIDPLERVIIVTDPGSPLHVEASAAGHRVFLADPEVGGRFSALTAFGMVPTTLAGVNTERVIDEASSIWEKLHASSAENPAVKLGAALSGADQDIAVLLADETNAPGLGDWIEQLVAESTGKDGKGVLPVVAEGSGAPEADLGLGDIVVVDLSGSAASSADVSIAAPLGVQFLLWEYATAFAGALIGLNPFDQPDVESAKIAARGLLDQRPTPQVPDATADGMSFLSSEGIRDTVSDVESAWSALLKEVGPSGYLAVHLYSDRLEPLDTQGLRSGIARRVQRPVTFGFGPRFLHSTGQFHKGGTPDGVFLQVVVTPQNGVDIPGYPFDFGTLVNAQSAGDRDVLVSRGRPVLTVTVESQSDLERFLQAGVAQS